MNNVAQDFVRAIASADSAALEPMLADGAVLRIFDSGGNGAHRPVPEVLEELAAMASDWVANTLEFFDGADAGDNVATDFRVQLQRDGRCFDLNGAAILRLVAGRITSAAFYFALPMRSLPRGRIVRANMTPDERTTFIQEFPNRWDMREFFSPNMRLRHTPDLARIWTKVAHPGSNFVRLTNWTAEEADQRIAETIDFYRQKGLGIQWSTSPFDTPADLNERLERQGFVRAGDQALMARYGIEQLDDIPTNPDITVVDLNGAKELWEDSLQINATAFQWSPEQVKNERDGWFEDLGSEPIRSVMALIDGKPVADAHLYLQSGVAYLGGAATLPEYRNRKIYSTLLRRRLEIARSEGYEVAMIHAEPMSRRVVSRFGFETQVMYQVYGWMEPMDLEVIKTLVQDQ